ncbi:hypothetical protein AURDEDRAFT_176558 [Auricularia subglabra TFB-10046 SS5]|uniref:F-box domain-containing protein n=1 Tax=Auricularia subglabra (strain TFB-10046 / SS5) TaxID=717982 RepID=J0LCY9_AURST|nr:hypothetical protein AURDEDRAFT_176558 [Auricularia subglabra TFB-10046 SS5]
MELVTVGDVFSRFERVVQLLSHDFVEPAGRPSIVLRPLNELQDFHMGSGGQYGRSRSRYIELCGNLDLTLRNFDENIASRTYLVMVVTIPSPRRQIFVARLRPCSDAQGVIPVSRETNDAVHSFWWQLRKLYKFFADNPHPILQSKYFCDLPPELIGYVLEYSTNTDAPAARLVCRAFFDESARLHEQSYSIAFVDDPVLEQGPFAHPFEDICLYSNSVYLRQLRQFAFLLERVARRSNLLARVTHLFIRDLCRSDNLFGLGAERLWSSDFAFLGRASQWLVPRFPSLRRVSFQGVAISNVFLDVLAGSMVDRIGLNACTLLDGLHANRKVAQVRLPRVRTVEFRIHSDAWMETSGIWNMLSLLPNLVQLCISPCESNVPIDLSRPQDLSPNTISLPNLITTIIVGADWMSLPKFLTDLAVSAPRLEHLHVGLPPKATDFMAVMHYDAGELVDRISAWRTSLVSLSIALLSTLRQPVLDRLVEGAPRLQALSWALSSHPPYEALAASLGRLRHLRLFRSSCDSQFQPAIFEELASLCHNLDRVALAGREFSGDVARWKVIRADDGPGLEKMIVDRMETSIHPELDATWSTVICP